MGNPATPVFKSSGSDKAAGPTESRAKLMFASWPLVQPLLAFGITTLATYATIVAALATTAIFGSQVIVSPLHEPKIIQLCPHFVAVALSVLLDFSTA